MNVKITNLVKRKYINQIMKNIPDSKQTAKYL